MKAFSPKILHKGLALVIIPFFFNAIWFWLLADSLARTAQLADLERKQNTLLEHLHATTQLFIEASGALVSYALTNRNQYKVQARDTVNRYRAEADYVLRNSTLSTAQKACLTAIRNSLDDQLKDLVDMSHPPEESTFSEAGTLAFLATKRTATKNLLMQANQRSVEIFEAVEREKSDLNQLRLATDRSRAAVNEIVTRGFLFNFVLAVVLVSLFIKDISQRLSVLVQNAQKLPKRIPLEKPVAGNDELSYLDEAMHKASEDLQKAFEFRSSLMQMVAHDLRSPIAAAQVSLELLADSEDNQLSQDGTAHLERVQSINGTLLAMINDLLTIDSLELGKLELVLAPVRIKTLADETIGTFEAIAKARRIRVSNLCGDENIRADGKRIIQVLNNFLANALKFSPSDTEIKFKTERRGSYVVVSVVDQGKGMAAATRDRVFDKFYRAAEDRSTDGFGLGLAICKLIVTSHGGTVGVESTLGQGSRFWFSLMEDVSTRQT